MLLRSSPRPAIHRIQITLKVGTFASSHSTAPNCSSTLATWISCASQDLPHGYRYLWQLCKHVSGMPANGLSTVCSGLIAQNANDGAGWNQLIVSSGGQNLRALSPNTGIVINPPSSQIIMLATSIKSGRKTPPILLSRYPGTMGYTLRASHQQPPDLPRRRDIRAAFCCKHLFLQHWPFQRFSHKHSRDGDITARLAAAFNRSTLLINSFQPDDENVSTYYTTSPTNHYARIVHAANLDGRGYAFPYDDVGPTGGADQSGSISDASPSLLTVAVGGMDASV